MEPVSYPTGRRRPHPFPPLTGVCYCGCGEAAHGRSYFVQGHDRIAEAGVVVAEYGGVADLLLAHGYGPDGKNARQAWEGSRKGRRS